MGFTMLEATRVEDAIAQVSKTKVDLITVDLAIALTSTNLMSGATEAFQEGHSAQD